MPGLGTSFGRGGATTAQQDLANADAILIMGSSMAENHPVGFQWVMEARERGAKIIHVDPRFTRTSAMADIWVPLRAGTDILFLGGLIHYVLENDKYFREYVQHYTNASMHHRRRVPRHRRPGRRLLRMGRGEEEVRSRDRGSTRARKKEVEAAVAKPGHSDAGGGHGKDRGGEAGKASEYETDPDAAASALRLPDSEAALLALHAGDDRAARRSSAEAVPESRGDILQRLRARRRPAAICYAVGWTQHSKGVQIIRSAAILQMLLGNIGRPGGGILALRGHASIQGSTDIPTLYDILPGYLPMPFFEPDANDFKSYLKKHTADAGLWNNFEKYFVSLMKAYYGDNATKENNWGFDYLPRVTGDHSHFGYWLDMAGRQDGRPVHHGPKSGGGRVQRAPAAHRDVEAEMAGGARHGGNRERLVVVQLARGRARRVASRRTSRPKYSCSRRRLGGERRLPDQHAAPGAVPQQGGRIRQAMRAAKRGSCITWRAG